MKKATRERQRVADAALTLAGNKASWWVRVPHRVWQTVSIIFEIERLGLGANTAWRLSAQPEDNLAASWDTAGEVLANLAKRYGLAVIHPKKVKALRHFTFSKRAAMQVWWHFEEKLPLLPKQLLSAIEAVQPKPPDWIAKVNAELKKL